MKRFLFGMFFTSLSVLALSEQVQIEYRRAQESDVSSVLSLMEEASSQTDKVLILPEACRRASAESMINDKHLFVAVLGNRVIATKKLFIAEGDEKKDLLENLIRSEGPRRGKPSFRGRIDDSDLITVSMEPSPALGVCVYDGFEYTVNDFRGQHVNGKLTEYAYDGIATDVKAALRNKGEKNLTLLYGLTYPNAGPKPGVKPDRTVGLARSFQTFIKRHIDTSAGRVELELSRYNSFLPTFASDSKDCNNPAPDEKSAPIYGYTLTYELKNSVA